MEENKNNTPVVNPMEGPMVEKPTAPVVPEAPTPVATPVVPEAPAPVVTPPMAAMESTPEPATTAPTEVKPAVAPVKKKRTALVVLIVLLIVAVIAALPFLFKALGIIDIF